LPDRPIQVFAEIFVNTLNVLCNMVKQFNEVVLVGPREVLGLHELTANVVQGGAGQVPLVEGLHGETARTGTGMSGIIHQRVAALSFPGNVTG
jgi:hypothetical protein